MRKFIYNNILFLLIVSAFNSCTLEDFEPENWAIDPELNFSENGIVFNASTGQQTIDVESNYETFTAISDKEWCLVTENQDSSRIYIDVEPNKSTEPRQATIGVTIERGNKTLTKNITVVQFGGYWDTINGFTVFWSYEISDSQKEAISNILKNMVYVNGGSFYMGGQKDDPNGINYDENMFDYLSGSTNNVHQVALSDYYIGKYELSQKEWTAVMGYNNSVFKGENLPVENISWEEALEFTARLSSLTSLNIQLPTEAQWEYAARGGQRSVGYIFPGSNNYEEVGHFVSGNLENDPRLTTVQGGTKLQNELGLYDMAGNVCEYCSDWYGSYDFTLGTETDPIGPSFGDYKVVRGGDLNDLGLMSRVFSRDFGYRISTNSHVGIRIVLKP